MDSTGEMQDKLAASIFEVLEKMYFIFLEPAGGTIRRDGLCAEIGFRGPLSGRLEMCFSRGLSKAMVQNMLNAEDADMNEPMLEDGIKEAVNMVCGNFLRKYNPSQVFDLQIPVFRSRNGVAGHGEPAPGERMSAALGFAADGEMLGVVLYLQIS